MILSNIYQIHNFPLSKIRVFNEIPKDQKIKHVTLINGFYIGSPAWCQNIMVKHYGGERIR